MEEFCIIPSSALTIFIYSFNHSDICAPFEAGYFVNLSVTYSR